MSEDIWNAIQARLEQNITESENGQWDEKSVIGDPNSPINENIMNVFADMGYDRATIDSLYYSKKTKTYAAVGDKVPWCAAYAGSVLKQAVGKGGYLPQNLAAIAYDTHADKWGGKAQGKTNYKAWRENDVVVMSSPSGGNGNHVGFLKSVDPKSNRFQMVGGNQGDVVSEGVYENLSLIYNVYRGNWTLPADKDVPVIKDLSKEEVRNPSTR